MTRRSRKLGILFFAALLMGSLACVGCNGEPDIKKVKLKIDWLPSAEYYGLFYAHSRGWFREAGFDVTIESAKGAPQVAAELAAGNLLVGTTTSGQVLRHITADEINFVRCVPLIKFNPSSIISLKSGPVSTLEDLPGTKLGVNVSSVTYKQYTNVMKQRGIAMSSVTEVPIGWGGTSFLMNGRVRSILHYVTNVGVDLMIKAGEENLEIIRFDKLERDPIYTYATVLCFAKQPKGPKGLTDAEIEKFTQAVLRGYEEGKKDREAAVKAILKAEPTLTTKKLRRALDLIIKLNEESTVTPRQIDTWMEPADWKHQRAVSLYN